MNDDIFEHLILESTERMFRKPPNNNNKCLLKINTPQNSLENEYNISKFSVNKGNENCQNFQNCQNSENCENIIPGLNLNLKRNNRKAKECWKDLNISLNYLRQYRIQQTKEFKLPILSNTQSSNSDLKKRERSFLSPKLNAFWKLQKQRYEQSHETLFNSLHKEISINPYIKRVKTMKRHHYLLRSTEIKRSPEKNQQIQFKIHQRKNTSKSFFTSNETKKLSNNDYDFAFMKNIPMKNILKYFGGKQELKLEIEDLIKITKKINLIPQVKPSNQMLDN